MTEISLDEVEDCYSLMLQVAPLTLIRGGEDVKVEMEILADNFIEYLEGLLD